MDEAKLFPAAVPPVPVVDQSGRVADSAQGGEGSFLGALQQAIATTNSLQIEASAAVDRMVTGGNQSLHQTLIALQEADVSFQLMMQVRNKIVAAYEEIQRMQI